MNSKEFVEIKELRGLFFETEPLEQVRMTIDCYNENDCIVSTHTGEFQEVFDNIPNFERNYYRVAVLGKHEGSKRVTTNYYGVKTTSVGGFKLSEESFLNAFLNKLVKEYAEDKRKETLAGQDYNFADVIVHDFWYIDRMRTLHQNTAEGFNFVLDRFVKRFRSFERVDDLNLLKGKNGIYLLVLDKYNACYFGQSNDIRKRIMRHWSRSDYFTGTGIDMYKAYDTTRIYAAITQPGYKTNHMENRVIESIPPRYTINCMAGGDIDYLEKTGKAITKPENRDDNFINYVHLNYNLTERIKENKSRFIIE